MSTKKWLSFFTQVQWLKDKYLTQQQFVVALSVVIGFLAGLVALVLKNLSYFIQWLINESSISFYTNKYFFVFPLIGLLLVYFIVKYLFKKEVEQGIVGTLQSISKKKSLVNQFHRYASLVTAPITVGFGGSVGLEAPSVISGASYASFLSKTFRLNQATRTLLVGCAAAGAMASIFKAPIAGIIFAIEIFSLDLTLASMIPLLTASVTAILTSYFFLGNETILQSVITEDFDIKDAPFYILLGVFAAFISIYFTKLYFFAVKQFKRINHKINRIILGGISISLMLALLPALYGEGYEVINQLMRNDFSEAISGPLNNWAKESVWLVIATLLLLLLLKTLATSLTVAAGGVGGIFAPVLFIGSLMGHTFGLFLSQLGLITKETSITNFTLVGMAGLMAGVMHAPLTAIFLIAEITSGYVLFIPLMITSAISFFVTSQFQKHSVYTLELAENDELVTHNKDQAILTLMDINKVVERSFIPINVHSKLRDVVEKGVTKSSRNIFPVVDNNSKFLGIILLDDIRGIMFEQSMYDQVLVSDLMQQAPEIIDIEKSRMKEIMNKFQQSDAWNLPVVKNGVYEGFISKSKLLTAYRQKLIEVTV
ncbi:chloride channel protein [Psychroflexus maritimus]|uniref:CBS domain-containing protein n=1 Tax=Psychroflexus maritimus TaxID=2714865 RepID=A0A967AEV9_9FLAO|nr:chloride channel protein [Psychroflexus maritimus]NGZ90821.1 CBS domain-containing protein [Psychroflexus maritimus]